LYLKEIQLENFKSFGRKIKIPFLEGFTAITGPNGSGKSNISDAVLFVLGPKSPKVIRAGKLTDLIFNGGKEKRPAKYTKVSLVFDNKDRTIPHDADEVILTRLVKISPSDKSSYNSYFYVNGRTSQMSHFQMLLDHARISAEGYNIVQQGDVTKLVTMGNIDRRKVFDSLAGITQYDDDIHRAQNEQRSTESNIEKVDIILGELEMDIRRLRRERNEAIKRKELQDLKAECSVKMEYKKRHEFKVQLAGVANNLKTIEDKLKELKEAIAESKRIREQKEKEEEVVEKDIAERGGEEAKELEKKINELKLAIHTGIDSIRNSNDRVVEFKQEISSANSLATGGRKERQKISEEVDSARSAFDKKDGIFQTKNGRLKEIEDKISKTNQEIMRLQKEDLKVRQAIEAARESKHTISLKEDRMDSSIETLSSNLGFLEEDIKLKEREVLDAQFMVKELKGSVGGKSKDFRPMKELQAEFQSRKNQEAKLTKDSRELTAAIDRLSREYQRLKTEKLAHERAGQGGYNAGVDMILQAKAKGEISGIIGTIGELANVEKDYETALTTFAGRRMQAVVVNNDAVAQECIEYLRQKRGSATTFLPLNKMTGGRPHAKALMVSKEPESTGFAIDLIDFDEKYRNAFWYVFQDTVVVKNMNAARKHMGGVMLVTLQGDVLDPRGGMTGGFRGKSKVSFGKKEMGDYDKKEEELNKAEKAAQMVTEQLQTLREELDELERELKERTSKEGVVYEEIERHKAREEEFAKKLDVLLKDKEALEKKIQDANAELDSTEQGMDSIDEKIEKLEKDRLEVRKAIANATPEKIRKEVEELKKAVDTLSEEKRDLTLKIDTGRENLKVHDERLGEIEENLKKFQAGIKENTENIKQLKQDNKEKDSEQRALMKVLSSVSKEMESLQAKRQKLHDEIRDMEYKIDSFHTGLNTNEELRIRYNTEFKAVESALSEAETIIQAFEIKYTEEEVANFAPSEELNRTVRQCEDKMERMGPVNMMAIVQYEEKDSRKKEVESNKKELLSHKDHLINLVDNFITKKKDGFFKVYTAVNENFSTVYAEISGGGEAKLVLENEEDPFEGGLTIIARPPGKKVHRIDALSGGEKSLTSLALIFSIQDYMPSPFYLLDEIDQNLDAINAEKVAQMVKKNSSQAQFLVVSLHKVTLKEADHVYGVTIQKSITDIIGNVNISDLKDINPDMNEINIERDGTEELKKNEIIEAV